MIDKLIRRYENNYMELLGPNPLLAAEHLDYALELKETHTRESEMQQLLWECEGEIEVLEECIDDLKTKVESGKELDYLDYPKTDKKLLKRLEKFTKDY